MADNDLTAEFIFTLAQASQRTVTLSWETRDGTAVEGIDYVAASGQLIFAPGETSKKVTIQVLQPPTEERKFFTVAITDAVNATVDETEPGQVVIMPNNLFRGPRGFKGDRGQRGRSAYEEAVNNGSFVGTYDEWLIYLRAALADLADPTKGSALVSFKRSGSNAANRTTKDKLGDFLSVQDYTTLAVAITEAATLGAFVEVRKPLTVKVPTDAPNLQTVFDRLYPVVSQAKVTVLIEAGHVFAQAVALFDGDYSNFRIISTDAEVAVSELLPRVSLLSGFNAKMPTLACLFDANGYGMNGVMLDANSTITIEAGCGVKRAYGTGLMAQNGSVASARGSNFTYAARNGTTGAGITAWGAVVDASDADVSFSGYYGAQAAHSGSLTFERGKANDCYRYGVRGSDRGSIDFSEGQASRCGVYGVYSFQNSDINAPGATVENCGSANVVAANASNINFRAGKANGATKNAPVGGASNYGYNIMALAGSTIEAFNAEAKSAADTGVYCEGAGSNVNMGGGDVSSSVNRGFYCTQSGKVAAQLAKANTCGVGVYVEAGGDFSGTSMEIKNCTTGAMVVNDGGKVSVPLAVATGGATHGLRALNGSQLNIRGANFQRGAAEDPTDIQCFSGSQISAALSIGGLNRTANTISAQGIIYK